MLVVLIIFIFGNLTIFSGNTTASATSDYKRKPQLTCFDTKTRAEFKGSYLKQHKIAYDHGKILHIALFMR